MGIFVGAEVSRDKLSMRISETQTLLSGPRSRFGFSECFYNKVLHLSHGGFLSLGECSPLGFLPPLLLFFKGNSGAPFEPTRTSLLVSCV